MRHPRQPLAPSVGIPACLIHQILEAETYLLREQPSGDPKGAVRPVENVFGGVTLVDTGRKGNLSPACREPVVCHDLRFAPVWASQQRLRPAPSRPAVGSAVSYV